MCLACQKHGRLMRNFGDMGITEFQLDLMDGAQRFVREKSPMASVRAAMETESGYNKNIWAEMGALGWLGIAIPEKFGGIGLSMGEVVPVVEALGRYMLHSPFGATVLAAQALLVGGTENQKANILPKISAGQAATLALSEHNGDWDLRAIDATATQTGSGYTLSGTKTFVQDLPAAQTIIVSVKLDGHVRLFVINADAIPVDHWRRERIIDDIKRSYELTLDGITVPKSSLMDIDRTDAALECIHVSANLLASAEITGAAQATIDYTVEYLKTRKQFGKLIGSFQALKHPIVDDYMEYEKARSLLYAAANSFTKQWPPSDKKGEIAVRMTKVQSGKALSFAADRSIQFHGGFGFTYDCDAQLYRRRAIWLTSQFGDGQYHKKKLADLIL